MHGIHSQCMHVMPLFLPGCDVHVCYSHLLVLEAADFIPTARWQD